MNKQELIDFESEMVELFEQKKILGPIHLSENNEEVLIEIFKNISRDDWVFSSWRNHYHALLHGVSREDLKQQIINSYSMSVCSGDPKLIVSSIVGGIVPIAVGTAYSLKQQGGNEKVWCFVGDMTAETGIYHESLKFAQNYQLPITFIIEDNGESVGSSTGLAWGKIDNDIPENTLLICDNYQWYYKYKKTKYPHVGILGWVTF
jgi:pyruvate dehydrogenase E1 component alpha subunit